MVARTLEELLSNLSGRVARLERRRTHSSLGWSAITSKPFGTTGHGSGTAQWMRVGWIDGGTTNNGASMELSFGTGGNYGNKERQTGRVHFAERNGSVSLEVISDLALPPSGPMTWHTRQISTYVYELWVGLATFNVPLTVQVVNSFPLMPYLRLALTMDMIQTTAPSGLSVAAVPKVLYQQVHLWRVSGAAETMAPGWYTRTFPTQYEGSGVSYSGGTFTMTTAGVYMINASTGWATNAAPTGRRLIRIIQTPSNRVLVQTEIALWSTAAMNAKATFVGYLAAGATITVDAYQNSTGDILSTTAPSDNYCQIALLN